MQKFPLFRIRILKSRFFGLAQCTMLPVRGPPDGRSNVAFHGASRCTGEEKECDGDQGIGRRSKSLPDAQDIVAGPLLLSAVLAGPQEHTESREILLSMIKNIKMFELYSSMPGM